MGREEGRVWEERIGEVVCEASEKKAEPIRLLWGGVWRVARTEAQRQRNHRVQISWIDASSRLRRAAVSGRCSC